MVKNPNARISVLVKSARTNVNTGSIRPNRRAEVWSVDEARLPLKKTSLAKAENVKAQKWSKTEMRGFRFQ
jgi:hypothetical protein